MRPVAHVVAAAVAGGVTFFMVELAAVPSTHKRSDADWFLAQGRASFEAKQFVRAREMFERCIGAYPKVAECHVLLGATYGRLGMAAAARREYVKFLDLAPTGSEAHRVRALLAGGIEEQLARSP